MAQKYSPTDLLNRFYSEVKRNGVRSATNKTINFIQGNEVNYDENAPFFKKYEYDKEFEASIAADNCLIDFELLFLYNRVQKAANSYTCLVLSKLKFGIDTPYDARKVKQDNFLKPVDLDSQQVEDISSLYKFTFVRNPLTRVLSCYLEKIENRSWEGNRFKQYFTDQSEKPTFEEFVDFLDSGGLYKNKHWAPQTSLLALPVEEYDHIGKLESYEEDFLHIADHLVLDEEIDVKAYLDRAHDDRDGGGRTSASKKTDEYYSEQLIETVRRLYDDDFENFDYSVDV